MSKNKLKNKLNNSNIALKEINQLLRSFLGRKDIKMISDDKGYLIKRNTETATFLSEGEKTIVAFAYWIKKYTAKLLLPNKQR